MISRKLVAAAAAAALTVTPVAASAAKSAATARQVAPAAEKVEEGSELQNYRGGILVPLGVIVVLILIGVFAFKGKKKVVSP